MASFSRSKYSKIYNSESLYSTKAVSLEGKMQLKNMSEETSLEELPQKVEDMYKILVGISKELSSIKTLMAEEEADEDQQLTADGDSLGLLDGDDYKTLMEMEEFKSQDSLTPNSVHNSLMYKNALLDTSTSSTIIGKRKADKKKYTFYGTSN